MLKITTIFILLTSTLLFAEDSYIFEAKGKFAEDLKALVEKYSKEGKIDVKVIKNTKNYRSSKKGGIIGALLGKGDDADISLGKKIYDGNCFQCHGLKADESSYPNSRILSKMSKQEIEDQVENYKRDINYGGTSRFVMYNSVDTLSAYDIRSVASYIKSIGNKNTETSTKQSSTQEDNQEESSSYLQ